MHCGISGSINLDDIAASHGLTIGGTYPLHLFHAERQTVASQFQMTTSLCIVDECPEKCDDQPANTQGIGPVAPDELTCLAATEKNSHEHTLSPTCTGATGADSPTTYATIDPLEVLVGEILSPE